MKRHLPEVAIGRDEEATDSFGTGENLVVRGSRRNETDPEELMTVFLETGKLPDHGRSRR